MSDILDLDLRDFGTAYHAWVDQSQAFEDIIRQWYVQAHEGREPARNDMHHAFWRVMVERDRWGTLRAALQDTWPLGHSSNGPAPVAPPEAPQPAPVPNLPDRPSPGSGGFRLEKLVRVTGPQDGEFVNRGYSYYSQCVILGEAAYAFAANADGHCYFFQVSERGHVVRLGSLLPYTGGEGWYFDAAGRVCLLDGPRLRRVNPFSGENEVVFDINDMHPGCDGWQAHSSDDGRTHSATVRRPTSDGPYQRIGTAVVSNGRPGFIPARGVLDESHLSGNGLYLLIEDDNDLVIHDLERGTHRIVPDREGALSHLDCGPDFAVGEDNFAGACVRLDLPTMQRRELFKTWGMGHLSIRNDVCLLSDATHLSLVSLQGSGVFSFLEHGMRSDGTYDTQVHGNLDPTGSIAAFVSNRDGRFDLYLAPVPR